MRSFIFGIILLSFFVSETALSVGIQNAKVIYVGTYGSGRFFVATDKTIAQPGCTHTRFDIDPNHPQINHWLSIAQTSLVAGRTVNFSTTGCYAGFPTMDQSINSFFYLN